MMTADCQRAFAGRALGYLMAARILHMTPARSAAVDIPELHLIGTGFEMLLKDALIQEGKTVEEVMSYGDRLLTMWELDEARAFRATCRETCEDSWDDAWSYETPYDQDDDPWQSFQDEIVVLADLHSRKPAFPFPYVTHDAPAFSTPRLLLATLQPIASRRAASFVDNRTV